MTRREGPCGSAARPRTWRNHDRFFPKNGQKVSDEHGQALGRCVTVRGISKHSPTSESADRAAGVDVEESVFDSWGNETTSRGRPAIWVRRTRVSPARCRSFKTRHVATETAREIRERERHTSVGFCSLFLDAAGDQRGHVERGPGIRTTCSLTSLTFQTQKKSASRKKPKKKRRKNRDTVY